MTTIDCFAWLKDRVAGRPDGLSLLEPVTALINRCAEETARFVNSDQSDLGQVEEAFRRCGSDFFRAALQHAAQQKAAACPPDCPRCGRALSRCTEVERSVRTLSGHFLLRRVRGWCGKCQDWAIPADEALGLDAGASPQVQELAALFAAKMPVAEASMVFERATGHTMPPATLDRIAKRAAAKAKKLRARQDADASLGVGIESLAGKKAVTLILQIDAWNIRERDDWGKSAQLRRKGEEPKRWHWVYTATAYRLAESTCKNGRPIIAERGYAATREGIPALTEQLHAEARRRGLGQVERVVLLGDGAAWIWNIAEDRFSEATQRVDLFHIIQHLWVVARELHPEDPAAARRWVRKKKRQLEKGDAPKVVNGIEEALAALCEASRETVQKELNYLKEHEKRMDYADAAQRNEPRGSGAIESTCHQYQCRFKRPGQFWTKTGDDGLLCLDGFWRNGRWANLFPHAKKVDPSKN